MPPTPGGLPSNGPAGPSPGTAPGSPRGMIDALTLLTQTLSQDIEQHRGLILALGLPWCLVLFMLAHRYEGHPTHAPEEE